MKKLVLLLAIKVATTVACLAQIYTPGTVILTSGDTLQGMVLDMPIQTLLKRCVFTNGKDTTRYQPEQLRGFTIEDRRYRSFPALSGNPSFLLVLNE